MRKNIFISLLASVILFANCSKDESRKAVEENTIQNSDELIKSKLKLLGFNNKDVIISGDTIIVEGDIILFKSKLLDKTTRPRQATTHQFPYIRSADMNLNIYIQPQSSGGFTTAEINVIKAAINQYLQSNFPPSMGIVSINYTTNSADPKNIRVVPGNLPTSTCGRATAPTSVTENGLLFTKIGGDLLINLNSFRNNLDNSQKTYLIVHEFGHMLGFRHTNWRSDEPEFVDGVGAYTVPFTGNSTANPDPNSVFNSFGCGIYWAGFSAWDIQAIKYVTRGTTSS
ncbi:M57 family metalloprotease [Sphingobacterium sp. ML3W]|uniref:M57 family metalloprotease n=1 Tax=Sphingobacterium sp. ML3W TaxID=1538644 RepID=UPI002499C254|nr:M57 family metalloprotease [Sphingobacterium sp. ML3W]WFA81841.1 M57 family metalloprotease [Sphingobacterium sp. ML3W]